MLFAWNPLRINEKYVATQAFVWRFKDKASANLVKSYRIAEGVVGACLILTAIAALLSRLWFGSQ